MNDDRANLNGIPRHLLDLMVRVWIDDESVGTIVETGESFFFRCDPDVIDYPDIVEHLMDGRTYRDGGGAEVEWSIELADAKKIAAIQEWKAARDAACRVDIAFAVGCTLADARAAFGIVAPSGVDEIQATISRQVANCVPFEQADVVTEGLIKRIDWSDLQAEAADLAAQVPQELLVDAGRRAVQPLRGWM